MDSNKAASSTTSLSRKEANEWWANDDNTLSEVPTLSELKIVKTVGLKAIARGVAKMYQMCLFRDSLDITPKLVLKIVLTFCKQNNKLDDDHYDALVADDGKELMLLTNELMATPLGKAYISELAREVRATLSALLPHSTLCRASFSATFSLLVCACPRHFAGAQRNLLRAVHHPLQHLLRRRQARRPGLHERAPRIPLPSPRGREGRGVALRGCSVRAPMGEKKVQWSELLR